VSRQLKKQSSRDVAPVLPMISALEVLGMVPSLKQVSRVGEEDVTGAEVVAGAEVADEEAAIVIGLLDVATAVILKLEVDVTVTILVTSLAVSR